MENTHAAESNKFLFPINIFNGLGLEDHSGYLTFEKDKILAEEAMNHKNVALILKGVVILFFENTDGTKTIIDFKSVGEVLRPAVELSEKKTGKLFAIAHSDTHIKIMNREFLCSCSLKSESVSTFYYGILMNDISSTYRQLKLLKEADLGKRYLIFLEEYKHIYNEISDRMIANYLGVHFTTLSRVKAKILAKERQNQHLSFEEGRWVV